MSRFFEILFFIFWCAFAGSYVVFAIYIVPKTLKRWANEHGYKIVKKTQPWIFKRASVAASNIQMVYDVVIVDKSGAARTGLIKIGSYWWPKLSAATCPIEVSWADGKDDDDWANP